eukprot:1981272-Pleurochrysis_carterae.AAC.3
MNLSSPPLLLFLTRGIHTHARTRIRTRRRKRNAKRPSSMRCARAHARRLQSAHVRCVPGGARRAAHADTDEYALRHARKHKHKHRASASKVSRRTWMRTHEYFHAGSHPHESALTPPRPSRTQARSLSHAGALVHCGPPRA